MGENGLPPAGTFSMSRPTGLAWPAAVATPAAGDPPRRLIGRLSDLPSQNFEKLLGDGFLVNAVLNLEAYHTQQETTCLVVQDAVCSPNAP